MGHGHHHHDHGHGRPTKENKWRLTLAVLLAGSYMLAEAIGGWLTNSLALMADAGHMLSDVAALLLALVALWIAERPPSPRQTYGYYRAEILAAMVNGAALVAIAVYILVEGIQRLRQPPEVLAGWMLAIAIGGLLVNLAGLAVLSGGKDSSLNVRGAWLHVLMDTLGSVGAISAAVLIWLFGWYWVDPIFSLLIAALVIYSAWALLKESVSVLMESVPRGIDIDEVRRAIAGIEGVHSVHALHVWSITTGLDALSAHVLTSNAHPPRKLLNEIRTVVHDRFGIDHVTIQIEHDDWDESACHR